MAADEEPQRTTWGTPGEAVRVVAHGSNLLRTTLTALVVGAPCCS